MHGEIPTVAVAGHICLDIIPALSHRHRLEDVLVPGNLVGVGAAVLATGGAVANTGLALHKLGVSTRLMGKVGDDFLGQVIIGILEKEHPGLSEQMIIKSGECSSYSIVISPPDVDRIFLHHSGTNDTFDSNDLDIAQLEHVSLFHFGYPPLMRHMYEDNGAHLEEMLRRVKKQGITTSLDMARPDPQSDAGRADWPTILQRTLPYVDVFLPSLEEILFMLDPDGTEYSLKAQQHSAVDGEILSRVSRQLLEWGAGIVGIKLGDQGLYLRTSLSEQRLSQMGIGFSSTIEEWTARELLAPCFSVDVVGTTGAGDCTVAGFLAALLYGMNPEDAMTRAVAVGAFNVESADATSGIQSFKAVEKRVMSGWKRRLVTVPLHGWTWEETRGIWRGPNDQKE